MAGLGFEWDEAKDLANQRKHGVTFAEAVSVFSDERALLCDDPDHSPDADRFVLLGLSFALRILVVHHTFRAGGQRHQIDLGAQGNPG